MYTGAAEKRKDYVIAVSEKTHVNEYRHAAGRRNRARLSARVLFLSVLVFCVTLVIFGTLLVSIYASISAMEVKRGILSKKIETEKQLLQKRKVEFASLSNPERIRRIASSKLKMMEATEVVFIELKRVPGQEGRSTILSVVTPLLTSEPEKQVKR